jgi:hypothetical protein
VPDPDSDPHTLPIPGSEITAALKAATAVRRFLRRPPPAAVLRLRVSRRDEIRQNIKGEPEVLIVNAKKWDQEGKPDNRIFGRGASNWFKAEVKAAADAGFEWFSSIEYVRIRRGKAFRVEDSSTPGARKVWVVGRLRYETITFIDWAPDPGSSSPRFYVEYSWRHAPHADVLLYEESGYQDHLYPLEGINYVGNRRLTRLVWRFRSARYTIEQRRRDRQERDRRYGG